MMMIKTPTPPSATASGSSMKTSRTLIYDCGRTFSGILGDAMSVEESIEVSDIAQMLFRRAPAEVVSNTILGLFERQPYRYNSSLLGNFLRKIAEVEP